MSDNIKPGDQTSEWKGKYITQGIIALGGFLVSVGVIPNDVAESMIPFLILLVVPEGTYAVSRGLAKMNKTAGNGANALRKQPHG